MQLRTA